jgi:hypothetical protein
MARFLLDSGSAQLRNAMDDLLLAWQETNELWNDGVSQKFSETRLEPLGPALKGAVESSNRMQQLLNQMQRDCEEEREEIF